MSLRRLKLFLKLYFQKLNYGPGGKNSGRHVLPEDFVYNRVRRDRVWINILFFIATFITTTLAQSQGTESITANLIGGLQYSCTLMAILSAHEFGHYFAARRFGVDATLPYFIPFPFPGSPIGTLGAVIKTRSPIPHRRALLYIGAMGPLPGFIVSLAAVIAGISLSQVQPILPAEGLELLLGDSLLFSFISQQIHGSIAPGSDLFLHPVAFAGWIGFLLTALNLMPVGQLDGGHILHALIGDRQRYAGWIFFAALVFLSFYWPGWIVWIIIFLFLVMVGHPHIHDTGEELTTAEKVMGWACMVILALTFVPVPVTIH